MPRVMAIVVTWNRCELLQTCLDALQAQRRQPDAVLVVDNASTDGTTGLDWQRWPLVRYHRLDRNRGGAGGFAAGVAEGFAAGMDWLWLLDDDSIAEPDALAALLQAIEAEPADRRPVLAASDVRWSDGRAHPLNRVAPRYSSDAAAFNEAVARGVFPIRAATFVSVLIDARHAAGCGLPVGDFFLWLDDIEYTARLLRRAHGIAVPASRVEHRTRTAASTLDAIPTRFQRHVRNQLWTIRCSPAYGRADKGRQLLYLGWCILVWLGRRRCRPAALWAIIAGTVAALATRPARHWFRPHPFATAVASTRTA